MNTGLRVHDFFSEDAGGLHICDSYLVRACKNPNCEALHYGECPYIWQMKLGEWVTLPEQEAIEALFASPEKKGSGVVDMVRNFCKLRN